MFSDHDHDDHHSDYMQEAYGATVADALAFALEEEICEYLSAGEPVPADLQAEYDAAYRRANVHETTTEI